MEHRRKQEIRKTKQQHTPERETRVRVIWFDLCSQEKRIKMKIQLPPPANWQDFEDLCHRLWSSIWGTNPQKNGRQGQPQCGVDIYGMPPYKSQYTGI